MTLKKKYITCTLPYANSVPHIGHAFEFIIGDTLTRYFRNKLGDENVHFNIGLDEHGKKIYDAATAAGKTPLDFLNELNVEWRRFCNLFAIEYNSFYRTSHSGHYKQVSRFWEECVSKDLIYKKQYKGNYCVGCESFKLEKDLVEGKCPDHQTSNIQQIEEENYFFRLSKFKENLLTWFETDCVLKPASKKEELKNIIENLEDISVSRLKTSVPWGIPVPNDPTQVIYVWQEALLNYIFILGYYKEDRTEFNDYWNESVQIFGPDNLKFQGAIFQGLLEAAGVKHTKTLLCHGTILDKDGKKMSKTVGNVVDPIDQLKKYGIDAVRYYAIAGLQMYGNSGWDEAQLVSIYNAHLADNYGNLVTRVVHLINLKQDVVLPNGDHVVKFIKFDLDFPNDYNKFKPQLKAVETYYENYEITAAMNELNSVLKLANQYITEKKPWDKESKDYDIVLRTLYHVLLEATKFYLPVIPDKAREIQKSLKYLEKAIVFPKITLALTETILN